MFYTMLRLESTDYFYIPYYAARLQELTILSSSSKEKESDSFLAIKKGA